MNKRYTQIRQELKRSWDWLVEDFKKDAYWLIPMYFTMIGLLFLLGAFVR